MIIQYELQFSSILPTIYHITVSDLPMIRLTRLPILHLHFACTLRIQLQTRYQFSKGKDIHGGSLFQDAAETRNNKQTSQSTMRHNSTIINSQCQQKEEQGNNIIIQGAAQTATVHEQRTRSVTQIVRQLKSVNPSSIPHSQIFKHMQYINSLDVKSPLLQQTEEFGNLCQIIEHLFTRRLRIQAQQQQQQMPSATQAKNSKKVRNKYITLSLQQTMIVAETIYRIKVEERIKTNLQKKYPTLLSTFQVNFKNFYRSGAIKYEATVQSFQLACKCYFSFFSSFSNLDYALYGQLAQQIQTNGDQIRKKGDIQINPMVLISVLQLVSQRFEISFKQRKMCDTLVTLLASVSGRLTGLQQLKLYLCLSKSIISVASPEAVQFAKDNREYFKDKFIGGILKDKSEYQQDVLYYFMRRCCNYNAPSFRWLYEKALNHYLSKQIPTPTTGPNTMMSVLKLLAAAGQNRQSLLQIQASNIGIIDALLTNLLDTASEQTQQEQIAVYSMLLRLFDLGLVPQHTAKSIVPFVVAHFKTASQQSKHQYFKFIYQLAMVGAVDSRFVAEIESWSIEQFMDNKNNNNEQKPNHSENEYEEQEPKKTADEQQTIKNTPNRSKFTKIRMIQIACIYAEYSSRTPQIINSIHHDPTNKNTNTNTNTNNHHNGSLQQQKQKLTKQLHQIQAKFNTIKVNVVKMSDPSYFAVFYKNLSKEHNLLQNFHRLYSFVFLPALISNFCNSTTYNSPQLMTFISYCVTSCPPEQISVICNHMSSHANTSPLSIPHTQMSIQVLSKLIRHFDVCVQGSSKRVLMNMVSLIGHYSEVYSSAQVKQQHVYQLCVLLSYPELVQYVSMSSSHAFFKILYNLFAHMQSQPTHTNSNSKSKTNIIAILNNFLLSLMSREYTNLQTHTEYFKFIAYVVNTHLVRIHNMNLLKKLLECSLQMNLLSRDACLQVHNLNFKFSKPLHRELFRVTYLSYMGTSKIVGIDAINYKQMAQKFPLAVFRHATIPEQQLRAVQQYLLEGIAKMDLRQLYTSMILFSLPRLAQDHQLVYLARILSGITNLMFGVQRSLLPSVLRSLLSILTHQPYQIHPLTSRHSLSPSGKQPSNRDNFYAQLQSFLAKLTSILSTQNRGPIPNQEHTDVGNRLRNNKCYSLPLTLHNDIMDMCYWAGVVPKQYINTLIGNCVQEDFELDKMVNLFMRISKLTTVTHPQFIEQLRVKLQTGSPSILGMLNSYSYELVMCSQHAQKPTQFLQSLFKRRVIQADSLIIAYIKKVHPSIITKVKAFPTNDNLVVIGQVHKNHQLLKQLVSQKQQSTCFQLTYCDNMRLFKSKVTNKIYGIVGIFANQSSASLMHSLTHMIAKVQNVSINNIFLCNQFEADEFFKSQNIDTPTALSAFQKMCKFKPKNLLVQVQQ